MGKDACRSEATLLPVTLLCRPVFLCFARLCRAEHITLFNVRFFFCLLIKLKRVILSLYIREKEKTVTSASGASIGPD